MSRPLHFLFATLSTLALTACPAPIDADPGGEARPSESPPAAEPPSLGASALPRLTHAQWERSVEDLLGLDDVEAERARLRADPNPGGALFDEPGRLRVDDRLWRDYQSVAEDLAARVTADDDLFWRLMPEASDESEAERAEGFVRRLGRRAHRRPLLEVEVEEYLQLFAESDLREGARAVVEVMLQSPMFLYRPELPLGGGPEAGLDDHQVAAKLSYALWGSMPDALLDDRADRGELRTRAQVREAAERMVADARTLATVLEVHRRLFDVDRYSSIHPPAWMEGPSAFGERLAEEHERFVEEVFETEGGLAALLTSNRTFVDGELAELYGIAGIYGDDWTPVDLDGETRRGILTTLGFLAKNAAGGAPDPIHRGVFISNRLACNDVPPPPDELPSAVAQEGQTNREMVESLTQVEGTSCAGCHARYINPYGFPFEAYDALGRHRALDNGLAVDTSSNVWLGGREVEVDDARELAELLAGSPQVHRCYAGHWFSALYGRRATLADDDVHSEVTELSLAEAGSIRELIVHLVSSPAFITLPTPPLAAEESAP